MKSMKRILSLLSAAAVAATCAAVFTGCGSSDGENVFEWFINEGETSSYYTDYADNPAVQYWTNMEFETGDDFKDTLGETSSLTIDYLIPSTGDASSTLSRLFTTGNYPDVVDPTQGSMTTEEAYEEGYIIDLTPYMEECMPNYMNLIREYDIETEATNEVDGERLYLSLLSFETVDVMSTLSGYEYRRDWILEYGTNYETGASFSGSYTKYADGTEVDGITYETGDDGVTRYASGGVSNTDFDPDKDGSSDYDGDSWTDNIIFPSWYQRDNDDTANGGMKWYAEYCEENGVEWDGSDPVTISDWEWMFAFFEEALEDNSVTDGYVHSIYYPGYIANGDFVTGFGGENGGGAHWYLQDDGYVGFGATEDSFRAYIECMNTWWNNGWIDQDFTTRSSDMFYAIDSTTIRQGKVGCWMGQLSLLGTRIYNKDMDLLDGVLVAGAPQPINDVYGTESEMGHVPTTFYAHTDYSGQLWITDKTEGKDVELLLRAIDYLYSEEGSLLVSLGMTKEQLAEAPEEAQEYYEKYGLEDGAYTWEEDPDTGEMYISPNEVIMSDTDLWNTVKITRLTGWENKEDVRYDFEEFYLSSLEQFTIYPATGFIISSALGFTMTRDESSTASKVYSRMTSQVLYQQVPAFIKGTKDIYDDDTWESFVSALNKLGVSDVTDTYNTYIAALKGES